MDSFAQEVVTWQAFYAATGTTAATLIGLLFVAISMHLELITDPASQTVLVSARRTFGSFIYIIVMSLLFLVPHQSPTGLAEPLLILGLLAIVQNLRSLAHSLHIPQRGLVLKRYVPSLFINIVLVVAAARLRAGQQHEALNWLVWVSALSLAYAANQAWDLLLGLAFAKRKRDQERALAATLDGGTDTH